MKGSIRARNDAKTKWEVRLYAGRDPVTGHSLYVSRTVHGGRRKAEDAVHRIRAELEAAPKKPATRGTVGHLLDRWLQVLDGQAADGSIANGTVIVYRSCCRRIRAELGQVPLAELDVERIDGFYAALRADGRASATIGKYHAVLTRALNQAVRWGWLPSNPAMLAVRPKARDRDPVPPSVEDLQRLFAGAERRNPTLANFLFTAATTGARRGELCAARWSNVDLPGRALLLAGSVADLNTRLELKDTKTHRPRRIALDDGTVEVLRRQWEQQRATAATVGVALVDDPFVFSQQPDGSQPYRPKRVSAFVYALRKSVGLPELRLHDLRHFMATQALSGGMDVRTVAGRLGHANPAITLRVYGHFMEERDRDLADSMGRLLLLPIRAE